MGIMTRLQGTEYVIASDRGTGDARTNRPPKRSPGDSYEVWTGNTWSTQMTDAKKFDTPDNADEYVRANFARVNTQS